MSANEYLSEKLEKAEQDALEEYGDADDWVRRCRRRFDANPTEERSKELADALTKRRGLARKYVDAANALESLEVVKPELQREQDDAEMVEKISTFLDLHSHVTGGEIGEAGQYLDSLRSIMNGDRG